MILLVGMNDDLIPLKEPLNPELPSVVTEKEAQEAATELGLRYFQPRKATLMKKIGLFQAQQGVVHLGVGRLAVADEALETLIETAVTLATDPKNCTEDRVGALMAGKHLVDSLQHSIELVSEFQANKLISGPSSNKRRSFVTDQPIVPIQAEHVTVNVVDSSHNHPQTGAQ